MRSTKAQAVVSCAAGFTQQIQPAANFLPRTTRTNTNREEGVFVCYPIVLSKLYIRTTTPLSLFVRLVRG
jgi:hypothetical protein